MNPSDLQRERQAAALPGSAPPGNLPTLIRDLLTLAKARVVSLLVFTAMVGEFLAPQVWHH
ncbi:MAG TPA: protoheme IX farnesyltransferase, partial [Gammaproteobacteria bacterium]|nr:protoheme IX farnesyltransferase [Gammaproteobacteria bacterium]